MSNPRGFSSTSNCLLPDCVSQWRTRKGLYSPLLRLALRVAKQFKMAFLPFCRTQGGSHLPPTAYCLNASVNGAPARDYTRRSCASPFGLQAIQNGFPAILSNPRGFSSTSNCLLPECVSQWRTRKGLYSPLLRLALRVAKQSKMAFLPFCRTQGGSHLPPTAYCLTASVNGAPARDYTRRSCASPFGLQAIQNGFPAILSNPRGFSSASNCLLPDCVSQWRTRKGLYSPLLRLALRVASNPKWLSCHFVEPKGVLIYLQLLIA